MGVDRLRNEVSILLVLTRIGVEGLISVSLGFADKILPTKQTLLKEAHEGQQRLRTDVHIEVNELLHTHEPALRKHHLDEARNAASLELSLLSLELRGNLGELLLLWGAGLARLTPKILLLILVLVLLVPARVIRVLRAEGVRAALGECAPALLVAHEHMGHD